MYQGLVDAVVLVKSAEPDNDCFGTAFIIHEDEEASYLLTCAHVIQDVGGPQQVLVAGSAARVIANGGEDPDLAVLRIAPPLKGNPVLQLHTTARKGDTFFTAGFLKYDKIRHLARPLTGKLMTPTVLTTEGLKTNRAWDLRIENEAALAEHESEYVLDEGEITPIDPSFSPSVSAKKSTASRFKILDILGSGGMGKVSKAYDNILGKDVALKYLHPQLAKQPLMVDLFLTEVRNAQELTHPNLCRVYDIFTDEESPYFSMEYVKGHSLAKYLRLNGPLSRDETLNMALQICKGLAALHTKDFVHRDLKPDNILLSNDGRVRITDFGLAELRAEAEEGLFGTLPYIAPEVLQLEKATARSDLYSLGALIYEISTGKKPFQTTNLEELLHEIKRGPVPPSDHVLGFDPNLDDLILKCLQFDPKERISSADEIASTILYLLERRSSQNPFAIRAPVAPKEFVGRQKELKKVMSYEIMSDQPLTTALGGANPVRVRGTIRATWSGASRTPDPYTW